jgi:hypothetical protein
VKNSPWSEDDDEKYPEEGKNEEKRKSRKIGKGHEQLCSLLTILLTKK